MEGEAIEREDLEGEEEANLEIDKGNQFNVISVKDMGTLKLIVGRRET